MLLVTKVLLHKAHSISWEGHTGTSNIPMDAPCQPNPLHMLEIYSGTGKLTGLVKYRFWALDSR